MAKHVTRMLLCVGVVAVMIFTASSCAKKKVVPEEVVTRPEAPPAKPPEVTPGKPPLTEEQLALQRKEEEERARREAIERARLAREQERLSVFLDEHVYFDFDKFDIKDSEKPKLERKKQWMMDHPDSKVLIEGHCDERGTTEYNLALGERRANACKQYLILLGIDPKRLSTISYGEERPVDPGHNEEAWAKNRRCQFVVISK